MCTKTWQETQQVYCLYKKFVKVDCTDACSTNCTHCALPGREGGTKFYKQNYSICSNLSFHTVTHPEKLKVRFQAI